MFEETFFCHVYGALYIQNNLVSPPAPPSERERSPLKERNAASPARGRSPTKASPFKERLASPVKERYTSPTKERYTSKASVEIPITHSPGKARHQVTRLKYHFRSLS